MPDEPPSWRPTAVLVTCEHAGNAVPPEYAGLFSGAESLLASHRGWDPGSLGIGRRLAELLGAPLLATAVTRLLVEPNRSPGRPGVFSERTAGLPETEKTRILETHYHPHRRAVEDQIRRWTEAGERVLHLGVHTFTDVLDGVVRTVDLGLLFDPDRPGERAFCGAWKPRLEAAAPAFRVRFNEPYLGTDDGLTTYLRTLFPDPLYAGVEIEVRQGLVADAPEQERVAGLLAGSMPPYGLS